MHFSFILLLYLFVIFFLLSLFENLRWPKRFVYFSSVFFFSSSIFDICYSLFGFVSSRKWQKYLPHLIRSDQDPYHIVLCWWFVANVKISIVRMQRKWNIWNRPNWTDILVGTSTVSLSTSHIPQIAYVFLFIWPMAFEEILNVRQQTFWNIWCIDEGGWVPFWIFLRKKVRVPPLA